MQALGSTVWEVIRGAQAEDPGAVSEFVERYRPAIIAYLRRRGVPDADSDDLSQEVFLRLFTKHVLERASSDRGRFRHFLIAVTRRVLSEHVRSLRRRRPKMYEGGESSHEGSNGRESLLDLLAAAGGPDHEFDAAWVQRMIELSVEKLRAEDPESHEVLAVSATTGLRLPRIARLLGRSPAEAKKLLRRARDRLRGELRRQIALYCSTSEEFEEEVALLARVLRD